MKEGRIAFLGAGRMASAMIGGLLREERRTPGELVCFSAADGTGEAAAARFGIGLAQSVEQLFAAASTVVLAFKPQQLGEMTEAHRKGTRGKLILSILAGVPVARLRETFPDAAVIVRAMPNTPGQIGAGITGYAPERGLAAPEQSVVEEILGSLGPVFTVDEPSLDAVTAVSGSGPAYLFEFVAALRDGGIAAGLDPELAAKLALETTLGAARLLAQSGETPEFLLNAVSSPGGTTLAGLGVMEEAGFRDILRRTVEAARRRSIELSHPDDEGT